MNISPAARAALGVGFVSFVLYLLTQAPGLLYTDVGELAAACSVWGVAHPTGYPLFTLIGHVWTMLPWPSVVKGLNILVALFTAVAAGMMVLVCKQILSVVFNKLSPSATLLTSITGAGLFATGTVVWAQSTAIEVYSLNLLLFVLALYTTVNASASHTSSLKPKAYSMMISGLLFGLMLANHISSVFLLPGFFLMWWLGVGKSVDRIKAARWLVLPMFIGPTLYALLPLRSASAPPINWGMVHRGWSEFLYHVKGTQFGVWMFSDAKAVRTNFSIFTSLVSTDLLIIGWLLLLVGLWFCIKSNRAIGLGLVVIAMGNLGISLGYAIPDIDSYFIPAITVLTLFATVGLGAVAQKLKGNTVIALVALPIISLGVHFKSMDYSKHTAVDSYTRWTLANAEKNAIIITRQWDFCASAMWYMQTVEGVRTDIAIIDKELLRRTWYAPYLQQRYPDVMKGAQKSVDSFMPWLTSFERDFDTFMADRANAQAIQQRFVAMLNAIVDANTDRPIYLTPEIVNEETGFAVGYQLVPVGPMFLLTKNTAARPTTTTQHLDGVTQSLNGRTTRLDSALTQTVLSSLYSDAMYALEQRADTTAFRNLRQHTLALDPKSRVSRFLVQRIP